MTTWRKSSYSDETGGQCIELTCLSRGIAVRDGKNPEAGHLELPYRAFAVLLDYLKQDRKCD
ncbi:DUF397 domain-containing protein [Actinomadura nitritigenes]|uniref:DUF397 domain-containing protein n=1 Tax=Actinomadura nitritigenes TaxID=134602 RepID=UPI00369681B3